MSQKSAIEWTDATWNPVRGCTRVSEGCRNCYAERWAAGPYGAGSPVTGEKFSIFGHSGPRWTGRVELIESQLDLPLHWRTPRRIFVNSMSDLFHESLPWSQTERVFDVMQEASWHDFQVLTKRAENQHKFAEYWAFHHSGPLSNVRLGVSCEDQATADARIPLLLQTPAAVRFLSLEPLLGPIDLDSESASGCHALGCGNDECCCGDEPITRLSGNCRGVDQVIVGGESGPGARPMNPDWVRSIRDQCVAAGVPFFFKQWGEHQPVALDGRHAGWIRVGKKAAGRVLDGRTWDEEPKTERQTV
jgi:protein gp37